MVPSIRISYAPRLPLELSFSPLLAGAVMVPPRSSYKLPRLEYKISSRSSPRQPLASSSAVETTPTSRVSSARSKPLPAIPKTSTPSHSPVVNLLDLLDRMDNDISCEVQRVRENIRETRALVKQVKSEQRLRSSEFLERREKESKETKSVHDEFWLGV
ncbi:uncharacterized protein B0H18DRAFT_975671 [Fomitopsis serialis]|uniref:uncharacterized protein n=1 Tax=Fomitopsis serialis TaxID=139415 RepID=UPI002007DF94|nr:uncharacterized protein B0H18DRAFT_975671 [Neoantrodia serialis]KAH9935397.1 hypothetical protein B0H18DRAFT_975671 [Neoantrodia serialis]